MTRGRAQGPSRKTLIAWYWFRTLASVATAMLASHVWWPHTSPLRMFVYGVIVCLLANAGLQAMWRNFHREVDGER